MTTRKPVRVKSARFLAAASDVEGLPAPAFAEVAFAGRSNVGKSSLINALVGQRKLVRTSGTPGATRTINLFRVELAEPEAIIDFVDLPGYGYAKRSKAERRAWGEAIEGFLARRPGLRAVVCIVDARRGCEEDDLDLVRLVESRGLQPVLVATKLDKLAASKKKLAVAEIRARAGVRAIGVSATTGEGKEVLLAAILGAASVGESATPS